MRLHACLPVLFLSALTAQNVERTYDLSELVQPLPGISRSFDRPVLLLPSGSVLPSEDRSEYGLLPGGFARPEPIAAPWLPSDLLGAWLEHLWDQERGAGNMNGSTLTLRAPMDVHTQVQDLLTLLRSLRSQSRGVTLFELPGGKAPDAGSVLTAAQVAEVLAGRPPVQGTSATVGHDVPWLWESGRSHSYVRDLDVEVAEKAMISDPKIDVFFVGTRVGLALTPMVDGRCLVRVGIQSTRQREPLSPRNLPGKKLGVIQLPRIDVQEVAASAALEPGGGLLLAAEGGERSWLLRVDKASPSPLRFGAAVAVPLGDLAVARLGPAPAIRFARRPGDDRSYDVQRRAAPDAIEMLNGLMNGAVERGAGNAQFGSHAVLLGANAAVDDAVRQRAADVRTASLTFRVGTVEKARGLAALTGSIKADDLAALLSTEVQVATLPGHEFNARNVREIAFVRDYEVEIASKSQVANPVVSTTFDGFRVSGVLHRKPGRSDLQLRLEWGVVPPVRTVDLGNEDLGAVDTPAVAWTVVERTLRATKNGWQIAHVGPDPDAPEERSLVLAVRVR